MDLFSDEYVNNELEKVVCHAKNKHKKGAIAYAKRDIAIMREEAKKIIVILKQNKPMTMKQRKMYISKKEEFDAEVKRQLITEASVKQPVVRELTELEKMFVLSISLNKTTEKEEKKKIKEEET